MTKTTRFTVSVPTELIEEADRVLGRGQGRSALVKRLLQDAIRTAAERRDIEEYIRSYTENPETEEEVGWLDVVSVEALREVPWHESR